jgi:hypothetical protein
MLCTSYGNTGSLWDNMSYVAPLLLRNVDKLSGLLVLPLPVSRSMSQLHLAEFS